MLPSSKSKLANGWQPVERQLYIQSYQFMDTHLDVNLNANLELESLNRFNAVFDLVLATPAMTLVPSCIDPRLE